MPLTLAEIPANVAVFLDANLFVYHFAPHPSLQVPCQQLLQRTAAQELAGVMREQGLTHLASHDADFDRVPGLTRYAPA